nr:MAG TPA: hypothetical protein [Caudoviricetes sp.]
MAGVVTHSNMQRIVRSPGVFDGTTDGAGRPLRVVKGVGHVGEQRCRDQSSRRR